jgi:hypothetical protein
LGGEHVRRAAAPGHGVWACVVDKKMPPTRGSAAVEEDRSIRLIKCLLKHYTFIV